MLCLYSLKDLLNLCPQSETFSNMSFPGVVVFGGGWLFLLLVSGFIGGFLFGAWLF